MLSRGGVLAFILSPLVCRLGWHLWRRMPNAPHAGRFCLDCSRIEWEPPPPPGGAYR